MLRRLASPLLLLALLLPLAQPLPPSTPRAASFPDGPPNDPNYDRAEEDPLGYTIFDEQWNLFGFIPASTPLAGALGEAASGIKADRAWRVTIGRPDVRIAVLDSGIYWEERELLDKVALNTGELPLPQGCASYDCNGDGVVDVRDYAGDPRVPDSNGNGQRDAGDLVRAFRDGLDQDGNGYTDDVAGWDFWRDDNDAYDEVRFGHGTGEAKGSAAATDNGLGGAGVCPRCMVVPLRIGDSFVVDANDFALALVYAVDNGIDVVQSAIGSVDWSPFVQAALDYAWSRGTIVVLSAADEDSFHHNMPGALEHTLVTKSVQPDTTDDPGQLHALLTTTYENHAACTNWGAHVHLASPSTSCSSGATEILAGTAGLVASRAKDLGFRITPAQAKQALTLSAEDIAKPESALGPASLKYPSRPGWDAYFGYGRTDAAAAVQAVSPQLPEVDLQQPRWFTPLRWQPGLEVPLVGHVRSPAPAQLTVEVAQGLQPDDDAWQVLRDEPFAGTLDGTLATWQPPQPAAGPPQGPDDLTWTLRVQLREADGVRGEDRKAVGVFQDAALGSQVWLGASLEGSPALADLDGDGLPEAVLADGGGRVHALRPDGGELPGWPVASDPMAEAQSHAAAPGLVLLGLPRDAFVSSAAVADLDGDGAPEVAAASLGGKVYAWHADGQRIAPFPVGSDHALAANPGPQNRVRWGFLGTPALADLDRDGHRDVIAGGYDQRLHAWSWQGQELAGFPVLLRDAAYASRFSVGNKVVSGPAVADLDGDGWLEVVVGTNEVYAQPRPLSPVGDLAGLGGSGRVYAVRHDGSFQPGWPARPVSVEPRALPLVGSGVPMSPSIALVDGQPKVAVSAFAGFVTLYNADGTEWRQLLAPPAGGTAEPLGLPTVANGAWGDLDGDGQDEYALGLTGAKAAVRFLLSGRRLDWQTEVGAWNPVLNVTLPGWPKAIEDWMFFVQPAIGDVDGDPATQEVIAGSGGYLLWAWDHLGLAPGAPLAATWPKYTGGWMTGSPGVGDLDGDGRSEVVANTREGWVFVWGTPGTAMPDWPMLKHDAARSGLRD
jgi:hypothetical protein